MGYSSALDLDRKAACAGDEWPEWFASDLRWQIAQRVVASQHFTRSRLLAKFLLYIVAETLEDRKANIIEHRIGVLVFDRPQSYSSIQDNIVRTYARQLRRRMAEYFAGEGKHEQLHIQIPLGGYIPVFEPAPLEDAEKPTPSLPAPALASEQLAGAPERRSRMRAWWQSNKRNAYRAALLAAYSALLVAFTWFAAGKFGTQFNAPASGDPAKPLWTSLFGGPENTYIVPADAGFNILEDISQRSLPLAYYAKGGYRDMPLPQVDEHSAEDLRTQQFTSFTDLQIVAALSRLPQFNPQRAILRFPRQMQVDDLKDSNAIILGSMGSNPWAAIAESNANFRIVNGEAMQAATILNARPQAGEAASYASHWNQPAHETYAIIAWLPNLGGDGHFLLLEGLDVAGTQAAAETLMHPVAIAPILQQATRPDGTLRSFEILIRSSSIASNSAGAQVIGSRIY
jgi:hypothetical protein